MYIVSTCDYCSKRTDKEYLARVKFDKNNINFYCPTCLPQVKENVKSIYWIQEQGYEIDYPYRKVDPGIDDLNQIDNLLEGMEYGWNLSFVTQQPSKSSYELIIGTVHFLDYQKNEIRVQDLHGKNHNLKATSIVGIQKA